MNRKAIPFLLAILPCAGCAPSAFRADAGAMFPILRGDAALQNSGGSLVLSDVKNDLHTAFGVGEQETSPYLRLEADWGPQRVRLHGLVYDASGNGVLQQPFGDLPAGTGVSSSLDYASVAASWAYDLFPGETFRLGPGVQLGWYSLDLTARSTAPVGFEQVNADVLMPQLYFEGGIDLGLVSLDADIGFMSASLGDAKGQYFDAEAMARLHVTRQVEAFVGYRITQLDSLGQASGRDFDCDLYVSGWLIGGGVQF